MAFPIITLDQQNVKRTLRPPIPPSYHLGLIPAGCALRRMKHFPYPEGKAMATQKLTEWSSQNSFLEGKTYLDSSCTTVIVTAFFLEVLPPHASTWEGQTYTEVGRGAYPYLDSPRDILASILLYNLDELTNDATRQATSFEQAWQQTDLTTDHIKLARLVEAADQIETSDCDRSITSSCSSQRFSEKQLTTLAQALYRVPYTIRRYTQRGTWNSTSWVYVLEPDDATGKRFTLEAQSHSNPAPSRPCSFITASTSYSFAEPIMHKTMTTLWNAAHTPTKRLPKLLQKGISRRAQ